MLHIIWEFRVRADRVREFERHYRDDGTWARFFRRGRGYRTSTLLRDREVTGRYLTIDVWDDLGSFRAFSEAQRAEYEAIDRRCELLCERERCLGYFESSGSLPAPASARLSPRASPTGAALRGAGRRSGPSRRTTGRSRRA